MSLKRKAIKSFIWDMLGKFIGQISSFAVGIVLARLLEPSDYGMIGMVMVIVTVSQGISDTGLGSALIQRDEIDDQHKDSVFYVNMLMSVFLSGILCLSAPMVARFYEIPELEPVTKALSFYFIIHGTTLVQRTIYKRDLKLHIDTQSNILAGIVSGILGIYLAYKGIGVWALVFQLLTNRILYSLLLWIRSEWRPKLQFSFEKLKELWSFGLNMFFSTLVNSVGSKLNIFVIGKLFSPSVLGLFTRAESLNQFVIKYSSSSLNAISFPALAAIQNDTYKFKNNFLLLVNLSAFAAFGLCGIMYLAAEPLIIGLLSEKWQGAIPIFKVLCLSIYAYPISAISLGAILAKGQSGMHLQLNLIKHPIVIVGMCLGFYLGGLFGYLYSLVLTYTICLLINFAAVKRVVDVSIRDQLNNILIFPLFVLPLVFLLHQINLSSLNYFLQLGIHLIIFSFLYLGLNIIFKTKSILFIRQQVLQLKQRF